MENRGQVTLSQVERALRDIGGEGTWKQILHQLTKNRNGDFDHYDNWDNYQKTAYQIIQQHCPGRNYKKYKGPPRFQKVGNKFRLNASVSEPAKRHPLPEAPRTPIAIDIEDPSQAERVKQETYRILRDTQLAREVKESNKYRCQICGQVLKLNDDKPYAEAHHIKPLGAPHNGPDVSGNILCVCPNDHVRLDYGAIKLDETYLKGIGKEYIDYHNENIFRKSGV